MNIITQKLIESIDDIVDANIIDWGRLNGVWESPVGAMRTIGSWAINRAVITIADVPSFFDAPQRDDWPGWKHVGNHEEIGKLYWNWFFWNHPNGELHFMDSPDFWGYLYDENNHRSGIRGDIGRVSASAFAYSQKNIFAHDIWVSVLYGGERHVIIEYQFDNFIHFEYSPRIKQLELSI